MKRLSLYFFFILIFNSSLTHSSEIVKGYMECKVKGIKLVSIEDGKHEEYTGYEKSFKKNDKFNMVYQTNTADLLRVEIEEDYLRSTNYIFRVGSFLGTKDFKGTKIQFAKEGENCIKGKHCTPENTFFLEDEFTSFMLTENLIFSKEDYAQFRLERYYKNDWNGLYVRVSGLDSFNMTFDCRHKNDKLSIITDKLKRILNQNK